MAFKIFLGEIANQLISEQNDINEILKNIDIKSNIAAQYYNNLQIIEYCQNVLVDAQNKNLIYNTKYKNLFDDIQNIVLRKLKLNFDYLYNSLNDQLLYEYPEYDNKTLYEYYNDKFNEYDTEINNLKSKLQDHETNLYTITKSYNPNVTNSGEDINAISSVASRLEQVMNQIKITVQEIIDKYNKMYLTTSALSSGSIFFNILSNMGTDYIKSVSYSMNNGKTWTTIENTDDKTENLVIEVKVYNGAEILWKADAISTGFFDNTIDDYNGSFFSSSCDFDVKGNVMSLIYGDDFDDKTELTQDGQFACLFCDYNDIEKTYVVNAENLLLPATTLSIRCYCYMFAGCDKLQNSPRLIAETLSEGCYVHMFNDCTSLVNAPKLPATQLGNYCYESMFRNCTSLVTAPELPALQLTEYCYDNMFEGCTSLVNAPELPAETLENGCYFEMFEKCSSLVTAPKLPATTLKDNCYQGMFKNCTSLNYIYTMFLTTPDDSYTLDWVSNVAESGTFIKNVDATWNVTGVSGIPTGWNIKNNYYIEYFTITSIEDGNMIFYRSYSSSTLKDIIVSWDNGKTWTTYTSSPSGNGTKISPDEFNNGDKILCKMIYERENRNNINYFVSLKKYNASGNLMSLIHGDNFIDNNTTYNSSFDHLFYKSKIVDATYLQIPPSASNECYQYMFRDCDELISAPAILPAKGIGRSSYLCMFTGCTNLINPPIISTETGGQGCCKQMFNGCESLVTAPVLNIKSLRENCYEEMFNGCSSLNRIEMYATSIGSNSLLNWVKNVASTGTFVKSALSNIETGVSGIPEGWTVEIKDYSNEYFTIESLENNNTITFRIGKEVTTEHLQQISYSIDNGETWITTNNENYRSSDITINVTINENETILWKGLGKQTANHEYYLTDLWSSFNSTNNYICYGNIMSLLYGDNFINKTQFAENSRYNFYNLFSESHKLTDISNLVLPATTLTDSCYDYMFSNCTLLVNAPQLPATTLAFQCYVGMFSGCISLINAPELPAKTLSTNCYAYMFHNCTSLTTAPELPAITLATSCYQYMLSGCTALVTAPELPVTTLAERCYESMFSGCTSLVTAPELPATTLSSYCYQYMFSGCRSLNYIKMLATNNILTNNLNNWVDGVASTGTFVKVQGVTIPSGKSGIPEGWTVEDAKHDYSEDYLTITSLEDNNVFTFKTSSASNLKTIYCSNSATGPWTEVTCSTTGAQMMTLNNGDKMLIKGENQTYVDQSYYRTYFTSTANFNVSGNIMSLVYGDDFVDKTVLTGNNAFKCLFYDCSKLISSKNLVLPATTLTISCYNYLFSGCINMTEGPEILPAEILTQGCYDRMFENCQSLTAGPTLPAHTLADRCYTYMFDRCISMTTAPELPAETLMTGCYSSMFNNCTGLQEITMLATNVSAFNCLSLWVSGVSSIGTFTKKSGTILPPGSDGIPQGWSVVEV